MLQVTIKLMGQVRVTGPLQEDLTPKGAKQTGLLALLAVAQGEFCSRVWLQNKLWSDRGTRQAQDSLRHAIAGLLDALGPYRYIVLKNGRSLALDINATLIDLFDDIPPHAAARGTSNQFLAGIDIRDREFEIWLNAMRARQADHQYHQGLSSRDNHQQSEINIGLLPVESHGPEDATMIGNSLANRLGMSLHNLGPFSIYDYSGKIITKHDNYIGPDVLLQVCCNYIDKAYIVTLSMRRVYDKKVIWSAMKTISAKEMAADIISTLVIQTTDQISQVLSAPTLLGESERHLAARLVLGAIDRMFAISSLNLEEAEAAFTQATNLDSKGVYYAWHAYLLVFKFERMKGQDQQHLRALANELASRALTLDKHNPLILALLAHVYAFMFRDFTRADNLIEPALAMQGDILFVQDSYALLNFYTGNLDEARTAAENVMRLSAFNPYRYCFATTCCMVETASMNFSTAAKYGERALAMHPPNHDMKFAPTLRYLTAALVNSGDHKRAAEVFQMLKQQEPDLNSEDFENLDSTLPNQTAQSIIKHGLQTINRETGGKMAM